MYQIIDGEFTLEGKPYRSYGIKTPSGLHAGDLSPDREKVVRFLTLLNQLDASEIHLAELIEDFLA